ncbi:23S rRNA (guanosine(2251)-2'-O)-methyltransferase RlmB [Acidipropionibacterium virtanenii]|uniref:Putative tRNA/rRNA methyltransferase n=1 Tax=Acidipropionibacterium virtanenii TaxID=2057246 RepID=A0A344UWH6_9ACTN|nr:23S rRNA (guanosine(2251)-2'-O)-methyltransferase RlmB [Acidipropionibacterium virtanenii]AXE39624.1 putative tRNA/rRNA methyltransferase [Acidipropionibacterium virtanenii]
MPGNSQRRGAGTNRSSKFAGKGATAGSGGRVRRGLRGRGPTPKAEDRPYHKAYKDKQHDNRQPRQGAKAPKGVGPEWVIGRNAVLEALHAGLPVRASYVAEGAEHDSRLREILSHTADHSMPMLQVSRGELDRLTGGTNHQGVAIRLPEYEYADIDDLIAAGVESPAAGLIVALDKVTDPRNLGAIIRSTAAFGAQGVLIPSRRSASMTAAAWKTSAGAAARIPVAMAANLNQALTKLKKAGYTVVGLAGEADADITDAPGLDGPLVLVIGSEGEGLARLTRDTCDVLASIPITSTVESLNASVAASIALYEVSRVRGAGSGD